MGRAKVAPVEVGGSSLRTTAMGLLTGIVTLFAIAACSSPELAPTPAAVESTSTSSTIVSASPTASDTAIAEPCTSGKLLIGDLPAIDRAWQKGIDDATADAAEWQQDAVISSLRVVCQLFETEFRWQATFYSRNAQAFYSSDTREVVPASIVESDVPELRVEQLSFALLHEALNRAGYGDEIEISPSSGVDIRINSANVPFGPPDAPDNVILYHVAIERLGEVRDVFVDGRDGMIYSYQT
jgi:hypothetical protein